MTATPERPELTPRDPAADERRQVRRRRGRIAALVAVALGVVVVVGQLAFGWVTRAVDATGLTCGTGWDRIDSDELAEMQVIRWGTPEAAEQGFDPNDFAEMPPGLAQPTLTTPSSSDPDVYDPILYPLGDGVVLQSGGFTDRTWVGADALTGEPLWGIAESSEGGFSTLQGYLMLVAERDDGRADLTTFDPRTGEKLSCVRLPGALQSVANVGEDDIVVAVRRELDDGTDNTASTLIRLNPATGATAWSTDLEITAAELYSDGNVVTASASVADNVVEYGGSVSEPAAISVDAGSGDELWRLAAEGRLLGVLAATTLPDGSSGTLLIELRDDDAEDGRPVDYVMLDGTGTEMWRVPALAQTYVTAAWAVDDLVIVLDDAHPLALDLATGEQRWASEVFVAEDRAVVLDVDGAATLLVTEGQDISEDGSTTRFFTSEVDIATGEVSEFDVPLRSAVLADGYLISVTGPTSIVVPLE